MKGANKRLAQLALALFFVASAGEAHALPWGIFRKVPKQTTPDTKPDTDILRERGNDAERGNPYDIDIPDSQEFKPERERDCYVIIGGKRYPPADESQSLLPCNTRDDVLDEFRLYRDKNTTREIPPTRE